MTFTSPYDMASWIDDNIQNKLKQEQLMFEGITHKKLHGTYCIEVQPVISRKTLLSQDDCAPDSLESFDKKFEALMHTTRDKFREAATYSQVDDGYSNYYKLGVYTLEIHAGDPYYTLSMEIED